MRSTIEVRVSCPGCGPMLVPAGEFQCEVDASEGKGLCEMRCPVCSAIVVLPAAASAVETLLRAGAGHMHGSIPFELLEPHTGPPLSWDDVLDFKLALKRWSPSE
jgi:hypothetical protein